MGLQLADMLEKDVLLAAFPLHDFDELKALQRKWLKLWSYPWHQPVGKLLLHCIKRVSTPSDDVKDYFGEKIALYFLYLQHYVTLLIAPAFLGMITYIGELLMEAEVIVIVYRVF